MASRPYVPGKFFNGIPCPKGHIADRLIYNKQCVECKRISDRNSNLKAGKKYRVKTEYGLTFDQIDSMNIAQGNACAICKDPFPSNYKIQIDHSHDTGKVRGLLCINCNWLLGKARDNPELLREAANYLERTKDAICLTNQ